MIEPVVVDLDGEALTHLNARSFNLLPEKARKYVRECIGGFSVIVKNEMVGAVLFMIGYDKDELHVRNLCVENEHRRRGYGYALMQHMNTQFGTRLSLTLNVDSERVDLHEFYKRLGYEDTGRRWEGTNIMRRQNVEVVYKPKRTKRKLSFEACDNCGGDSCLFLLGCKHTQCTNCTNRSFNCKVCNTSIQTMHRV